MVLLLELVHQVVEDERVVLLLELVHQAGSFDWGLDGLSLALPGFQEVVPVELVGGSDALSLVLIGLRLAVQSDAGDLREDEVVVLAVARELLDFEQGRAESS